MNKKVCLRKTLVLISIVLFIGITVQPSIGLSTDDDTNPPVTTYTLDPPEPDGLNGWYVNDINITFNATDDISGVKEIRYIINGGSEHVIHGDNGSFILSHDGSDIEVEYWAIDNCGNVETKKTIMPLINMDQRSPYTIGLYYDIIDGNPWQGYGFDYIFYLNATDGMSGMNRVEFYLDDVLHEIVYGSGPLYEWIWHCFDKIRVKGFILNPEITEEYVRFYAILIAIYHLWNHSVGNVVPSTCAYDNAGNCKVNLLENNPCSVNYATTVVITFHWLTLPNNYSGHLGRFFVFATFDTSYQN